MVKHSVHTLVFRSLKRSHDMFLSQEGQPVPEDDLSSVLTVLYEAFHLVFLLHAPILILPNCRLMAKVACKVQSEHFQVKDLPPPNEAVAKITMKTLPPTNKLGEPFLILIN